MAKGEKIEWKSRIVGHGEKRASEFTAHPHNFRTHPQGQRRAVRASLDDLGWVNVVIENVQTGYLIDGHERIWNALQNDDAEVPYIQVDLTPEEEAQALLSLDPIAAMAGTDAAKMDELLRQVQTDNADVAEFLSGLAERSGVISVDGSTWEEAFSKLPDEDRAPFQQMTFTLHDTQAERVKEAIKVAKATGDFSDSENENSNGNALAWICEAYLNGQG